MDYLRAVNLSNICSLNLLKVKNNWDSSKKSCPRDLGFFVGFYRIIIECSRDYGFKRNIHSIYIKYYEYSKNNLSDMENKILA